MVLTFWLLNMRVKNVIQKTTIQFQPFEKRMQ